MRICVATIGDEDSGRQTARDVFGALAALDEVGEHHLHGDPQDADAILVVNLQQHPGDPLLKVLRDDALVRKYSNKVFVYDERDRPFFTFPGIYVSGTPRFARRRPVVGGPYPNLPNAPCPSDVQPDLLYSFQGGRTHPVRDAVLSLRHPRGYVEDTSALNFFAWAGDTDNSQLNEGRARYAHTVARSKFVLCPRGHGPSSFRLYESIFAGRVPVVISNDWLPPPSVPWDRCVIRVAEDEVTHVPRLLERAEASWPAMMRAGREALAEHLAPSRLWHHYASSIADLRQAPRMPAPWWAQPQALRVLARKTLDHQLQRRG